MLGLGVNVWIPMMTRFVSWEGEFWNKNFEEYKTGFGLVNQQWIGLENLHQITTAFNTHMRVDYSFDLGSTLSTMYYKVKVEAEDNFYKFSYESYSSRDSKF